MIKIFQNSYLHPCTYSPVHLWDSDGKPDMKQEMTLLLHMKDCKKVFLVDRGHFFHYGRDNGRSNASAELSWHSEIPGGEAA